MSALSPEKWSRCTELKRPYLLVLVCSRSSLGWIYKALSNLLVGLARAEPQALEPQAVEDPERLDRNSSKLMERVVLWSLQLQVPCL